MNKISPWMMEELMNLERQAVSQNHQIYVSFRSFCCLSAGSVEDEQVRQFSVDTYLHNFVFPYVSESFTQSLN